MRNRYYLERLLRDIFIVAGSIIISIFLVQAGIIDFFIGAAGSSKIISSILAGAFFTSIFTVAPSVVGLLAIGQSFSPVWVAFFGAFGAMAVDIVIVNFIRKDISEDLKGLTRLAWRRHFIQAFHFGFLKWVALFFGTILIASPLPDEAGLFLIGVSRINPKALPLIFYLANFFGIYLLVSLAQAL